MNRGRNAPQPLGVDQLGQALEERVRLAPDLAREPVVRDERDVLQPVLARHGQLLAAAHERHRPRDAKVLGRHRERERELLGVARVVLQEDEPLVQLRVERREVVEEALLAEPL